MATMNTTRHETRVAIQKQQQLMRLQVKDLMEYLMEDLNETYCAFVLGKFDHALNGARKGSRLKGKELKAAKKLHEELTPLAQVCGEYMYERANSAMDSVIGGLVLPTGYTIGKLHKNFGNINHVNTPTCLSVYVSSNLPEKEPNQFNIEIRFSLGCSGVTVFFNYGINYAYQFKKIGVFNKDGDFKDVRSEDSCLTLSSYSEIADTVILRTQAAIDYLNLQ